MSIQKQLVKPYEAAFIRMAAQRHVRLKKAALAEGEEYQDLQPPTQLECGATVKLVLNDQGNPSIYVYKIAGAADVRYAEMLASELLNDPAKLVKDALGYYEYVIGITP